MTAQVMCGRFSLIADIGELADPFEFDGNGLNHAPGYNIAPTQMARTVTTPDMLIIGHPHLDRVSLSLRLLSLTSCFSCAGR